MEHSASNALTEAWEAECAEQFKVTDSSSFKTSRQELQK